MGGWGVLGRPGVDAGAVWADHQATLRHKFHPCYCTWASSGCSMVKNLPADAGGMGSIPGQEDSLEKMSTHSSIPAWEIPWTEEPGRLQSMGLQKSQT